MQRDIENRYYDIKADLRDLIDSELKGYESAANSTQSAIICNNEEIPPTIYTVNANAFTYALDATRLALVYERIQEILDAWLLEGGRNNIWAGKYVDDEYRRGAQFAFTGLSAQSELYASATTLSELLFSEPYKRRIGIAYARTYSDWKGLSDAARADLCNVISDAVARGVNPRETKKVISKRLDVSMSKANTIAQTEQVGALREAIWDETQDVKQRLGLNTMLLHLSALKDVSRRRHVYWHGRVRTVSEVREWYTEDGNRYNCYCNQTPILVDESGKPTSTKLIERLAKQREEWQQKDAT